MKRIIPVIIWSCFLSLNLKAQSSCTQTLRTARATYDQGRLHELPALLEGCLKNGFTDQEKVEAYKLLALTYIYLEESAKADEAMLNLLRTDHYFEINTAADPAEFIALYKTFRTKPIYRIGGKVGANATSPFVVESVEANDGKSEYTQRVAAQFHVNVEIPVKANFVLSTELGIVQRSFNYTNTVKFTDTSFVTKAIERQTWISLPVSLQYQFSKLKFQPYVAIGVEADYLLSANLSGSRTRKGYALIEEKTFDVQPNRNKLNISAIASAGVHYKLGGGFLIGELRLLYGIKAINSKSSAYAINADLPLEYGYADSVFKLNSLSATVGYVYNIFKPKKLTKRK